MAYNNEINRKKLGAATDICFWNFAYYIVNGQKSKK